MPTCFPAVSQMKSGPIIFVLMFAFCLVATMLGGYVTAYVQLGEYTDFRGSITNEEPAGWVVRYYGQQNWAITFFDPAAKVESVLIGCPVYLVSSEQIAPIDPPIIELDQPSMPR